VQRLQQERAVVTTRAGSKAQTGSSQSSGSSRNTHSSSSRAVGAETHSSTAGMPSHARAAAKSVQGLRYAAAMVTHEYAAQQPRSRVPS
jgi:hypothetical protein